MTKTKKAKVGAPRKAAKSKLTGANLPVHFPAAEFERYEAYCRKHDVKLANFFREAAHALIATGTLCRPEETDPGEEKKIFIVRMPAKDMNSCKAFAKKRGASFADFFRAAALEQLAKDLPGEQLAAPDIEGSVSTALRLCQDIEKGAIFSDFPHAILLREQIRLAIKTDMTVEDAFVEAIKSRLLAGDSVAKIAGHDKTWKTFIRLLIPAADREQWSPRAVHQKITSQDVEQAIKALQDDKDLKDFATERNLNAAILGAMIKTKTGSTPRSIKEAARAERSNLLADAVRKLTEGEPLKNVAKSIGMSEKALEREFTARTGKTMDK